KDVICGYTHTFIIKNDNTIWSCGSNTYGHLGLGDTTDRNVFTKVAVDNVKNIVCGGNRTFIIKNDNTILFAGSNLNGQIGCQHFINNKTNFTTFTEYKNNDYIGFSKSVNLNGDTYLLKENGEYLIINKNEKIICENVNTIIIKNDGGIWACGSNSSGQLGLGDTVNRNVFTKVDIDNVKDVICGGNQTFVIKNDGS
ncbi:TPA: hypothetical protein KQD30_003996, partial [Clostridioides difficile]|nr:hypothetical protein [Clostridioides difficile]